MGGDGGGRGGVHTVLIHTLDRLGYYNIPSEFSILFFSDFFSMNKLQLGLIDLLMSFKLFILGILRYGRPGKIKYKISFHYNILEELVS